MTILHYASGDLKLIINELDVDALTADDGGQKVLDHVKEAFIEHMEKKLPKAMERALYAPDCRRQRGETMIQYVSRKKTLFTELDRTKCILPADAKGYIMLRDASLSDKAWDTIETWTKGTYALPEIATNLRKLERPIPGRSGSHLMGLSAFVDTQDQGEDEGTFVLGEEDEDSEVATFMCESLFVVPESFNEGVLEDALQSIDDPEILWVAGDLREDIILEEDEAVAILANYGQVRNYLHKKQLGRGFFKPPKSHSASRPPSRKGGGKGERNKPGSRSRGSLFGKSNATPKKWSRKFLISRSKCARCGKIGHWARECTNEPDERGKKRAGFSGFMALESNMRNTSLNYLLDVDDEPEESAGSSGFVFVSFSGVDLETFVGLYVCPGYALVDTGAQHGVIGRAAYDQFVQRLAVQGLNLN